MPLRFQMLGAFEVLEDDRPVPLPHSKKARATLAYVAMGRRPIPRDRLVELFFGETRDPKGGLRWVISRLRAALGKDAIETTASSIVLPPNSYQLDVERLEVPIAADASISALADMEGVIRGEFLADVSVARCPAYEAWRLANQVTCSNRHSSVLNELVGKTLGTPAATSYARKLVNLDVTREKSWALLIESLLSANQLSDARHMQRLAIEQLDRDGVRLAGMLESVWNKYGAHDAPAGRKALAGSANGLGLKPRVGVLRGRAEDVDSKPLASVLSDVVYHACNVNKTVTVLAPSMSAQLDDDSINAMIAARALGVDFLLACSTGKRKSRRQVEVELIDASSGDCVFTWRKSFDEMSVADITERLEAFLAARMEIDLHIALVSRVRERPSDEWTARDKYLLALPRIFSADGFDPVGAYELLEGALSEKPYFGQACCTLSLIRMFMPQYNDNDDQLDISLSLARRAVEICQDDAFVLGIAAANIAHITRDSDTGLHLVKRALSLNPYSIMAGLSAALISHYGGDDEGCIRYVDAVESNSETEPVTFYCHSCRAMAHYQQQEYEEALAWSRKAVGHNPKHIIALRYMLASLGMTGNTAEATELVHRLVAIDPSENVTFFERRSAYVDRRKTEHLCEGLRRGGMPEIA
ncbi:MAG: hypothetical protein ACR2QZ_06435 [Woeseiaceae bacterium]